MLAISATDAISPAVQRTKVFLFRPFNWGTYLKLCVVAVFTEGFSSNMNSSSGRSSHTNGSSHIDPSPFSSFHFNPLWIPAIVAMVLLTLILIIFAAYLVTRLRFAFFHCLIHNTRQISPGWHFYRTQATRFFLMNMVVGLCYLVLVGVVALPFIGGFWRLFHETAPGGTPPIALLLSLVLPLIPLIFLLVLLGITTDVALRDWMMPHYALENATVGDAWARVWACIRIEKRQFLAYTLLRLILPIVAMIALFVVLIIPGLMLAGSLAAVEFGLHSAFADSTGASAVVGLLVQVFFGVLAFAFAMLAAIFLGGPLSTATREYALIFYGSRYQALGDLLYPPLAPPETLNMPAV